MEITANMLAYELGTILKRNAPVRDGAKHPGRSGDSPFPGNLKQNGIRTINQGRSIVVQVGYPDAPYAPYTEKRSKKKGWQKRSNRQLISLIKKLGAEVTRQ